MKSLIVTLLIILVSCTNTVDQPKNKVSYDELIKTKPHHEEIGNFDIYFTKKEGDNY